MAVNITYAVIGSPVKITANCEDISAVICFTGRTICDNGCEVLYDDERLCTTVEITEDNPTTGTIEWNGLTVEYEITRDCPSPPSLSCETKCDRLEVVPVPMYVDENYTGDIELHYNNYFTETCDDGSGNITVKSRVKNEDVAVVPFTSFTPSTSGEFVYTYKVDEQKYPHSCTDDVKVYTVSNPGCEDTCRVDLSIKYSLNVIPSTGATITVTVLFKKVVTDTDCHRMTKTGSFSFPWEVPECKATTDTDYHCCKDHYESGEISLSEILEKGHIDNSCDVYYNGKKITDKITYSLLQKAKLTDECETYCEPKTTYCADQSSVVVYYETSYMSNEWVSESKPETLSGCDCTGLVIDGVTGSLSVPFTGGRIKVTWNYSGETVTADCTKYPINGTWEEIINIGGCDERPIDCKDKYKIDETTFSDCEICDSECCYNYDGSGTCRCVIYFKERTPDCDKSEASPTFYYVPSVDDTQLFDTYEKAKEFAEQSGQPDAEIKEIIFNLIRYEFVQDCTPVCDYVYRTECDKQTIELPCEFEGGTSYTVTYSAVTEYVGVGCPDPVKVERSTTIVLENITKNDTPGEKVLVDNEFIKVVQKPCWSPPSTCSCDDLILEGGDDPDVCNKMSLTDPTPVSEGCSKLIIKLHQSTDN